MNVTAGALCIAGFAHRPKWLASFDRKARSNGVEDGLEMAAVVPHAIRPDERYRQSTPCRRVVDVRIPDVGERHLANGSRSRC